MLSLPSQVSYMIVDCMHKLSPDVLHPPGTKDVSMPNNSSLCRFHPADAPPLGKTASLSGLSEGEQSPVVKVT